METFSAKSISKPRIDHLDEEHMLGATCTALDSKTSDREVSVSSTESGHDNSLEVDAVSKISSVSLLSISQCVDMNHSALTVTWFFEGYIVTWLNSDLAS
ncbi:kinesin protein KIN-6 [Trifolium repens]|nr:kinesin protein KIN-6 [Trifolium repens]